MKKSFLYVCSAFVAGILLVGVYSVVNAQDPVDIWTSLIEGNMNFASGKTQKHNLVKQRESLTKGQAPKTIVVTCSDSRVAPEYIFDQGLGEIFVVRVAGNVMDKNALGSVEYAAEHLHSENIIVMGHQSCGAVKAALAGKTPSENINSIIEQIEPAVEHVRSKKIAKDEELNATIEENVRHQIEHMTHHSEIIHELMEKGKLTIKGAVYSLETGKVTFVK